MTADHASRVDSSDPAFQAAMCAWLKHYGYTPGGFTSFAERRFEESVHAGGIGSAMVDAAREALAGTEQ